jgi:hypothetical protein
MNERLIVAVRRDQYLNIFLLLPGVFLYNLACFLCIRARPDIFLEGHKHFWLASGDLLGFAAYLWYVLRYFKQLIPVLSAAREEWHGG